jgi:hypothetical protein
VPAEVNKTDFELELGIKPREFDNDCLKPCNLDTSDHPKRELLPRLKTIVAHENGPPNLLVRFTATFLDHVKYRIQVLQYCGIKYR